MHLSGVDIREGVLEMYSVYGVEVEAGLKTQESGVALRVLIGQIPLFHDLRYAFGKDIVFYAVRKEGNLCRD